MDRGHGRRSANGSESESSKTKQSKGQKKPAMAPKDKEQGFPHVSASQDAHPKEFGSFWPRPS